MFTLKHFVLLLNLTVEFAPTTEVFEHTRLSLIVLLPNTAVRCTVSVISGAGFRFGVFLESIFFDIFGIFRCLFSLIFKFYYLVSTIDGISLKTVRERVAQVLAPLSISATTLVSYSRATCHA